jgi:hypothetical protein
MYEALVPMLVLSCLTLIKMFFFKIKEMKISLAILLSLLAMVFLFESHFDEDKVNAPLFMVAIPIAVILLAI